MSFDSKKLAEECLETAIKRLIFSIASEQLSQYVDDLEEPDLTEYEEVQYPLEETEDNTNNHNGNKPLEIIPSEPTYNWEDLLGSGVIMKKIISPGEPDSRGSRSEILTINFVLSLPNGDIIETKKNNQISLGEGDVIQGMDVALGLMNRGERCLLKIGPRLAYGSKGLPPNIPSDATIILDLELVDIQSALDCEKMSFEERQEVGQKKREKGNWWYQREEFTQAIQCYRIALDFLEVVDSPNSSATDLELQLLLEDRLKILNNLAVAQIKMDLHDQALVSLKIVLQHQPNNVKALYRKAKIFLVKNDAHKAKALLKKAQKLEPNDGLINKELRYVDNLIRKQQESEKEYAKRMFGGKIEPQKNQETSKMKMWFQIHVWVTIGVIIGLAGIIAYRLKYS
ncbi:unnamed protein product [Ceutorhynchus assimilis]|uniref:peptidylprolyl isomerase n=1 Tax=Ceutorhynchus assimilis TaxID=467358 RepID=A0A9P0GQ07_9CUCU|nr:unnamed protein product [Ceutorhynchus assimilis]